MNNLYLARYVSVENYTSDLSNKSPYFFSFTLYIICPHERSKSEASFSIPDLNYAKSFISKKKRKKENTCRMMISTIHK